MWLTLLTTKDQAATAIKRFKAGAEVETGRKLRLLRTDRGGEFTVATFAEYCADEGIGRQLTAPYSPQQNGVVERRNQTIVSTARSMLKAMGVPARFWGEAVSTAVYLLNRSPTKSVDGKTPFEVWYGYKPDVSYLRVFGCIAHVKVTKPHLSKLEDRSTPMVFLGYEPGSVAYRVFDPARNRMHITRDVVFDEGARWDWEGTEDTQTVAPFHVEYYSYPATGEVTAAAAGAAENRFQTAAATETQPATPALTSTPAGHGGTPGSWFHPSSSISVTPATTSPTPPRQLHPMITRARDGIVQPNKLYADFVMAAEAVTDDEDELCLAAVEEPASVDDALAEACWKRAMDEELASIRNNKTWEFASLPQGHRAIGLKWVFKVKKDPEGNVIKHKARLVAKGYAQRQGVDFDEVFAPVARMETVRLMLAIAAHCGWQVHHMDVRSAFLNGELAEEVYVHQPPGYASVGNEGKVLRLHKALYGLRQAPRAWNAKLDASLASLGFERSPLEHAVYKRHGDKATLLVGVYVDDLIITAMDEKEIALFKKQMHQLFDMSDLGLLSYYLGLEVKQDGGTIMLCQSAYAKKILDATGMAGCNVCHTPMENRLKLSKASPEDAVDATRFRSVVGSLRYLCNSRPDITHAVDMVSRFMEAPSTAHWAAVK
jgi:hypothetical protein